MSSSIQIVNVFISIIVFTTFNFAHAENFMNMTIEELLEVEIVSSTGTNKKVSEAPSIATVITAKEIERSSAQTLSDVMRMVPGVSVYLGTLGQSTRYDIRGIKTDYGPQVLTLLNGISIDTAEIGSPGQRFRFPASAIERVEIIRGPGSAVYGADAFSGIINIVTKNADHLKGKSQAGLRFDSLNSMDVYGNYGFNSDQLKIGLNLSYIENKNDEDRVITNDLQSDLWDPAFSTNASLAPGPLEDEFKNFNLNLNAKYKKITFNLWGEILEGAGVGAGAANTLDTKGEYNRQRLLADLQYATDISKYTSYQGNIYYRYSYVDNFFRLFPPGTTLPIGDDGNIGTSGGGIVTFTEGLIGNPSGSESKLGIENIFIYKITDNHNIRFSLGYNSTEFNAKEKKNFGPTVLDGTEGSVDGTLVDVTDNDDAIFSPNKILENAFVTLQDELEINKKLSLTTGVRYDHYSTFGNTTNPRLGLIWKPTDTVTSKLLYGKAFRAPSIAELYFKNNPSTVGNPDLKPETIDMVELGSRFTPSPIVDFGVNLYWYQADDLIARSNAGLPPENVGKQFGKGLEMDVTYQATGRLLLRADFAYRWTRDADTKERTINVPEQIGHIFGDWNFKDRWHFRLESYLSSSFNRASGDTRSEIPGYAVFHSMLRYRVGSYCDLALIVKNLLDTEYYEPSAFDSLIGAHPQNDIPMEGRSIVAGIKYDF